MNQIIFTGKKYILKIIFLFQLLISLILSFILCGRFLYEILKKSRFENIPEIINRNIIISNIYNAKAEEQLYFGKIYISKIDLEYNVFNNFSDELLEIGPCKFYGNDLGKNGNICIVGHNYDNGQFFSNLYKVEKFDEIIMEDKNGKEYNYIVYEKYETEPDDLTVLKSKDKIELTLLTCNNKNKKRIVIKAYMNQIL